MRKPISIILAIAFFLSCFSFFSCSSVKNNAQPTKKTILFLGDSIAEAVAGPTPFNEREYYGYYGIIGNTNDFAFYNRAVSASTTEDLLSYVKSEDDGVEAVRSLITVADIIHISIVGNDLILSGRNMMMRSIASGNLEELNARKDRARANLQATLDFIRSLNPKATIFLQTLYNPVDEASPLISSYSRNDLAAKGYSPERYHELMNIAVRKMNEIFVEYIEEHAAQSGENEPTYLTDVYTEIEKIYQNDRARWNRLFQEDGIHPKNEGHAVIAEVIQQKLNELSLAGKDVLNNCKSLREAQLERLFPDLETKDFVLKEIQNAKTIEEVNLAYFNGTENIAPINENKLTFDGSHFDQTTLFRFDELSFLGQNLLTYFNANKSYLRFFDDGRFEITGEIASKYATLLKYVLDGKDPLDLTDRADLAILAPYLNQFFPGADHRDLDEMLSILESAYGIEIDGIDKESEAYQSLCETFRQTERILLSSSSLLKEKIRLRYKGQYKIVTYDAPLTGEKTRAIYLNNAINRGESYARLLLTESEDKTQSLRMTIPVLQLSINASTK